MKRFLAVLCSLPIVALVAASSNGERGPSIGAVRHAAQATGQSAPADFDQAQALAGLRKQIAGHERDPAASVFKDIQVMKGATAGQLLAIMEMGYSPALGVTCTFCHIPGRWESNDKKEKTIARGMIQMNARINNELLPTVAGLASDHQPVVNCTTCHRGQLRPALTLR